MLHAIKYNDNSLIVHLYSEEHGRMAAWVRIPKSHKSKVKSVLFQPLSLLELDIDFSTKNGNILLKKCHCECHCKFSNDYLKIYFKRQDISALPNQLQYTS